MHGSRCSIWEPSSCSGFMGTAFGPQGSESQPQKMLSWRSCIPCTGSYKGLSFTAPCSTGLYSLLWSQLSCSRDGEGTPQGKDTLNCLKKLLTLQNASTSLRCYYSPSHFPIWIAENNWWGSGVTNSELLILALHCESGESWAWKYTCEMISGRGEPCSQAWIETSGRGMGSPDCGFR